MNAETIGYKAKAFEARNLVIFFLWALGYKLLAFLFEYLGLIKEPIQWNDPGSILSVVLLLPAIIGIPSMVAFVITGFTEDRPGIKALWKRFWNRNVSIKWLIVALLLLYSLRLVASVLTRILVKEWPYPLLQEGGIPAIVVGITMGFFFGLFEEFGWRGYALHRLQVRWNALTSSLILGVITSLWHLSHFYSPGQSLFGVSFWPWFVWNMLIQVVGYTWIYNNTNGNILAVVLFHATTNYGIFALNIWVYNGLLLITAILIVAIFGSKDLVMQKPIKVMEQEKLQVMGD
jgi:membrane protease YdiL (CAAX protease family)